jgi:glycosyltransferase involved in cell wall biosynthesis
MAQRPFIKNHNNKLIGYIHNPAPIVDEKLIKKSNFRQQFGIASNAIIIVIVGRMVYDKGIFFIKDAIKNIENKELIFVFIGDGIELDNMKMELRMEIETQRVLFLGKQKDVISILAECNIFLFATLHENLSNALLEACSLGLAIIATNVGGNVEVIKNKQNGILIPSRNYEEIIKAINFLVNNRTLMNEYGRRAKETAYLKFSQDILLKKLDDVYSDMLAS